MTIEHADSVELVKTAEPTIRVTSHWQEFEVRADLRLSARRATW